MTRSRDGWTLLDRDGWTLLEVVVALGLTGLVLAAAWQARPLREQLALRHAAVGLVGDLRAAQARALNERSPDRGYGIEFPAGGDRYSLFVQTGSSRSVLGTRSLPAGVRITYVGFGGADAASVYFSGVSLLGAPTGGGTVTFSTDRARLCVRMLPATGRIRIAATSCP